MSIGRAPSQGEQRAGGACVDRQGAEVIGLRLRHDRAAGRHHDTGRRDDHVHLPPGARRPVPGRPVPDGCAEHPSGAGGDGVPAGDRRLLRDAAVPVLPRRSVPGVRGQRRGHARSPRADGDREPDRDPGRRRGAARCRRGRRRSTRRQGRRRRVLHERRPHDRPRQGVPRPHRRGGIDPRGVAGARRRRLAAPRARHRAGRGVLRMVRRRPDGAGRRHGGHGGRPQGGRRDVQHRLPHRGRARLRAGRRALPPRHRRSSTGSGSTRCCAATWVEDVVDRKLGHISSYEDARAKARAALPAACSTTSTGVPRASTRCGATSRRSRISCGARSRRSTTSRSTRPPRCSARSWRCR